MYTPPQTIRRSGNTFRYKGFLKHRKKGILYQFERYLNLPFGNPEERYTIAFTEAELKAV